MRLRTKSGKYDRKFLSKNIMWNCWISSPRINIEINIWKISWLMVFRNTYIWNVSRRSTFLLPKMLWGLKINFVIWAKFSWLSFWWKQRFNLRPFAKKPVYKAWKWPRWQFRSQVTSMVLRFRLGTVSRKKINSS